MTRQDFMIAVLAAAEGASHTPVQVQKLFFLLDENVGERVGGRHFAFRPWDYGPFDRAVYDELEQLESAGLVQILRSPGGRWRTYDLTKMGQEKGEARLRELKPDVAEYIRRLSRWVRSLSFSQLVSSIYRAYPEMAARSVFQHQY